MNERGHNVAEAQMCKGYAINVPPARYANDDELLLAWMTICEARAKRIGVN